MRIGILTFHSALNYGAVLQAFALKTVLDQMGHSPIILDYCYRLPLWKRIMLDIKAQDQHKTKYWKLFKEDAQKYLTPISPILTKSDISSYVSSNLDAVIVGSDQVWRLEFSHIGLGYFLDFCTNIPIKRISYAASFGSKNWNADRTVTTKVRDLLQQFDAISVREASGVNICNDVFKIFATHVLDPTLLLDVDVYKKCFDAANSNAESDNLISYLLGEFASPQYYKLLNKLANQRGLTYTDLYYTSTKKDDSLGTVRSHHYTPTEWLASIYGAKYVVTNSFHATVFSILFRKQFLAVESANHRSSRLESLLGSLGLTSRLVTINDVSYDRFELPIDYDSAHSKLSQLKSLSENFLNKNLQ